MKKGGVVKKTYWDDTTKKNFIIFIFRME